MNTTKILTIVNIYYPFIYHALAKYACNSYRKCTGQVLNHARSLQSNNLSVRLHLKSKAILLLGIALLHMFSLSAQTPRKDSGADGFKKIEQISLGQKVPDTFWSIKHLFYINGDTLRKSLAEYKGKILVLDFWFSGCTKCLLHQKEINYFKEKFGNSLAVVMVNSKNTKDTHAKIKSMTNNGWFKELGIKDFVSVIEDEYLSSIFPSNGYPTYFWINKSGNVQLITYRNLLDRNYQAPFIDLKL